ncbi:MAG: class I SAM-dependent methyltransferase [Terriglobia bacterium]|nr:MAG: class I SAM-dependent methyltransferase [Terriglobia bacterium]
MSVHERQVSAGERFRFGENWQRFLSELTPERIAAAEHSLQEMLEVRDLRGRRLLDAGSGSGLFSLAARRLGASVVSFDYDPQSVACTGTLKERYFHDDPEWTVVEGSVLDTDWLARLGLFDIVYSWGVLHHTGNMWQALDNVSSLVRPGGKLFISIYNDQGSRSRRWKKLKKAYNSAPRIGRVPILVWVFLHLWWFPTLKDLLRGKPFQTWRNYGGMRGMSAWRDVVDWAGGYPFEVARPDELFNFYRKRGFTLAALVTCAGSVGCNEFVFEKNLRMEQTGTAPYHAESELEAHAH